jgi:uncharacterized membrane protein
MRDSLSDYSPLHLWITSVLGLISIVTIGAVFFPRQVYDGFLWRYFWGPVVADGSLGSCAVREGGRTSVLLSSSECTQATGIIAYPGYTTT